MSGGALFGGRGRRDLVAGDAAALDPAEGGRPAAPASAAETEARITADLLHALDDDATTSQRGLAARLGIALGLTNAYLKRCVRKGWVKVQHIPPNRYAYYLTPRGFSEKSRLTAGYLARSFRFYRSARDQCDGVLQQAADAGWRRIALIGEGDLAEIALLCALQCDLEIVGVVDPKATANRFRHVGLVREMASLGPLDGVVITDLVDPQSAYRAVRASLDDARILSPALLNVSRAPLPPAPPAPATPAAPDDNETPS